MRPELHDLRVLKLAEMYEGAFEGFLLQVAVRDVDDPELRAGLLRLSDPQERHHERILEHMGRLGERIGPDERHDVALAALMDVEDVERAAHDFYVRHADQVHDREVARLFRELAAEEAEHARVAARLVARAQASAGGREQRDVPTFRALRESGALPLREGVSDFGSREFRPPRTAR